MSLLGIAFAWALVAVVFLAAGRLGRRPQTRGAIALRLAEALILTLLAALWFGSLGHGSWLLVFLLLGALAAGADRQSADRSWGAFLLDLGRYVAAGALLAWRIA